MAVLRAAIAIQAAVMVVFTTADGVPESLIARIIQGLSTGAAAGAIGAGMLDLNKAKGDRQRRGPDHRDRIGAARRAHRAVPARADAPGLPGAAGRLAIQGVGVALMPETSMPSPGAVASVRPTFAVPVESRAPLLLAAPALAAVWALAGLYGVLGPALARRSPARVRSRWAVPLAAPAASGAAAVLALGKQQARTLTLIGTTALIAGVGRPCWP